MASNELVNQISNNYNSLNVEISDMKTILASQTEKLDLIFNIVEGDGRAGMREQLITLNTKFELFEREIDSNRIFKRSVWIALITTGLGLMGLLFKSFII